MPETVQSPQPFTGLLRFLVAVTAQGPQKQATPSPASEGPGVSPEFDRVTRMTRQVKFYMQRARVAHIAGQTRAANDSLRQANNILKQVLQTSGAHQTPVILGTLDETADILTQMGQPQAAIRSLTLYVKLATETQHFGFAADGLMKLGALYAGTGEANLARDKMGVAGQYYRMVGSPLATIAFRLAGDVLQELEMLTAMASRSKASGSLSDIIRSFESVVNALAESEPEYRAALGDDDYDAKMQKNLIILMGAYHKALLDGLEYMVLAITHSAWGFITPEWQRNIILWGGRLSALIQNSSQLWGSPPGLSADAMERLQRELKMVADQISDSAKHLEFFELVRILSEIQGVTPDVTIGLIGSEANAAEFRTLLANNGLDPDDVDLIMEEARKVTPARTMRSCIQALKEVEDRGL